MDALTNLLARLEQSAAQRGKPMTLEQRALMADTLDGWMAELPPEELEGFFRKAALGVETLDAEPPEIMAAYLEQLLTAVKLKRLAVLARSVAP